MRNATDWIMRKVRHYRRDDNPLRRPSDRLESAVVAVAIVLFVLCVWPAVAWGKSIADNERDASAGKHREVATLLETAPAMALSFGGAPGPDLKVRARWGDRTGLVTAPSLATAGSEITVWVDDAGALVTPPRDPSEVYLSAVCAAVFALMLAASVLFAGFLGFRALADRRRSAEWERAWAHADERWRRPRQGPNA